MRGVRKEGERVSPNLRLCVREEARKVGRKEGERVSPNLRLCVREEARKVGRKEGERVSPNLRLCVREEARGLVEKKWESEWERCSSVHPSIHTIWQPLSSPLKDLREQKSCKEEHKSAYFPPPWPVPLRAYVKKKGLPD